jgi:hypothetical protein
VVVVALSVWSSVPQALVSLELLLSLEDKLLVGMGDSSTLAPAVRFSQVVVVLSK